MEVTFKLRIRVSRRGWGDEMGAGGGVCRENTNQMSWSWLWGPERPVWLKWMVELKRNRYAGLRLP